MIVAIVVTYFPDQETLLRQLAVLRRQCEGLIVVDNGSSGNTLDGVRKLIAESGGPLGLIELGDNLGIATAQNRGITLARTWGASHVLLMDQDSQPAPDMVPRLLDTLVRAGSPPVAAVGPCIHDARTGTNLDYLQRQGLRYRRLRVPTGGCGVVEVGHLIASGTLIPMDVLDALGGMDEPLFIDAVDTEWCLRARARGYRLLADTQAVLTHELGARSRRVGGARWGRTLAFHPPFRQYYIFRNNLLLCRRPYVDAAWKIRIVLALTRLLLLYLVAGPQRLAYLRAISSGALDALRGRAGKLAGTF
ncbi:glycosyltransferase family 2 protein [Thauera butanivorans]|uniref:glycosyltransferase family 2 protein n=1 Tax=Thauera butanivorans TaxID=86174 RepID=UPI000838013E|nr:glycosyltransferase family 2 protein [Thauera butanivorans]